MKYFLLQRLHSKSHNLDKFDILDEQSTSTEPLLFNCTLSSQDKIKNTDSTINSFHPTTRLFLEGFSSQRMNFSPSKKYSLSTSFSTVLRGNKFFNLLDICLNSKSLSMETVLDRSASHLKLNFKPNFTLEGSLLLNNTSKLLTGKYTKVTLLYNSSYTLIRYFG